MNNLKHLITELRDARAKATVGKWFSVSSSVSLDPKISAGYPTNREVIASLYDGEYIENMNWHSDAYFIALAANRMEVLLELMEELVVIAEMNGIPPTLRRLDNIAKEELDKN